MVTTITGFLQRLQKTWVNNFHNISNFNKDVHKLIQFSDETQAKREELYINQLGKYKFYLSFENALCRDYITEKFYLALHAGTLPIVYGGRSKADYLKVCIFKLLLDLFCLKALPTLFFLSYVISNYLAVKILF